MEKSKFLNSFSLLVELHEKQTFTLFGEEENSSLCVASNRSSDTQ